MISTRSFDKEQFEQDLPPLDEKRRHFVQEVATTLTWMARPGGLPSNRFRKLLISQQSDIKEFLVSILQAAEKAAIGSKRWIIPCYIDCSLFRNKECISDKIASFLPWKLRIILPFYLIKYRWHTEIWVINTLLREYGFVLFLVVDRFECLYKSTYKNQSIPELLHLGGFPGDAIHCIITGDGSVVSQLAFCEFSGPISDYPNYDPGLNLNRTKYEMVTI
jgi:hypothetical protein